MHGEKREMARKNLRYESLLTDQIIGAAIEVHRHLGPAMLESAYETCLEYELLQRNLKVERQKGVAVTYKGIELGQAFRMDLIIEGRVIVELKTVEKLLPVHESQILSYLKFANCRVGLLINFRSKLLKDGLRRFVL